MPCGLQHGLAPTTDMGLHGLAPTTALASWSEPTPQALKRNLVVSELVPGLAIFPH